MKKILKSLICLSLVLSASLSTVNASELNCGYVLPKCLLTPTLLHGNTYEVSADYKIFCYHCTGYDSQAGGKFTFGPFEAKDESDANSQVKEEINKEARVRMIGGCGVFLCDCVKKGCSCKTCEAIGPKPKALNAENKAIKDFSMLPDASSKTPIHLEKIKQLDDIKWIQKEYVEKHYEGYHIMGNMYTIENGRFIQIACIENHDNQGKLIHFDMTDVYRKLRMKDKKNRQKIKALEDMHKPEEFSGERERKQLSSSSTSKK